MKLLWFPLSILALVAGLAFVWWFVERESGVSRNGGDGKPVVRFGDSETSAVTLRQSESAVGDSSSEGSPLADELNSPNHPAEEDVEIVRQLIGQYLTAMQRRPGPPIGDDRDLVRVLTGKNPLRAVVISPTHRAIDREGRLLDRWGTPYHLHPLDATAISVRSAGPDRRLFTPDDLVAGE